MRIPLLLLSALLTLPLLAQQATHTPPPAQKPLPAAAPAPAPMTAANPDGSITFRYTNSGAHEVIVQTDATQQPLTMQKSAEGVWSVTTPPLKPEHYGYSFKVDGVQQRDPLNLDARPNIVSLSSSILVPGSVPQPWELQAIPHGALTRHMYTTHTALNLPVNEETYIVYTPPGYDAKKPGGYPMLALLHGWSDNAGGWTAVGQANDILDKLLAEGKIVPMVVVMPMGYGDYHFVTSGFNVWQDPQRVDTNTSIFSTMLLSEVLPAVQREYNVSTDPNMHAIAGLSMGGLEALSIGLRHPEIFTYVAGMSAAVHGEHFDQHFPAYAGNNGNEFAKFKLLWVGCGTEDGLIKANRDFVAWAKSRNLPVVAVETPGQHTWLVWRQNLLTVAPLLFR